jgi:hypothetical protein
MRKIRIRGEVISLKESAIIIIGKCSQRITVGIASPARFRDQAKTGHPVLPQGL